MKYLLITFLIVLFIAFLYWAYLPDYRRNPREFWRTIIVMPIGMLLGGIGLTELNDLIKKWALKKKDKN